MATVLQVTGGLTLLVLIALVVGLLWIRRRLRRFSESLMGNLTGALEATLSKPLPSVLYVPP